MNQTSRQKAKDDITKDFYKLMNNSNFGYDCRNNLDNCKFNPIFDEPNEITNENRYHNIFNANMSDFVSSNIIKQYTEEKFSDKIAKLNKDDQFYNIKYQTYKDEFLSEMEAAKKIDLKKKKIKEKRI